MDANLLHNKAMDIAEQAYLSKMQGDYGSYIALSKEAFLLESKAASLLMLKYDMEPSRSILYRSAATLALDCGETREAERLISAALMGNPPDVLADELRDLLENVHFSRHLDLRGVVLARDECQFSIVGNSVGFGIALTDRFIERVQVFERMLYRTTERKLGKTFREKGRLPKVIADNYPVYMTIPRAASFAVSFKIGRPTDQLELELPLINTASDIVDEIASCFDLVNKSEDDLLKSRFTDVAYYNNFLGLVKQIAPDGDEISQVGLTIVRNKNEIKFPLTRIKKNMPSLSVKKTNDEQGESVTVRGTFLYADSMSKENKIKLKDESGNKFDVRVPPGMMADIVKPLYEDAVIVTGIRKKNTIELEDIRKWEE